MALRRIKFNTRSAGPGGNHEPESVCAIEAGEAARLVAGGYAQYLDETPPVRPAEAEPPEPEPAVQPRKRKR